MTIDEIYPKFSKMYRKALVTGGAGFIGSHICEELVTRGFLVISIDDYSAGKKENLKHLKKYQNFQEVNCDITDKKKLSRYFKDVDIVFHNAASKKSVCLINPLRDLEVNGGGTFSLLELAKENKIKKFVQASTGSVYGEALYFPQDENHLTNPVSYYGVSKLAGEKYVQVFHHLYGLNTTVLRYFHVYGSRQESNEFGGVVAIFIWNILENKRSVIFGTGRQERSFTYVDDIIKVNLLVAIKKESNGQIYNCASAIKVTINELYKFVSDGFGYSSKPIYKNWVLGDIKKFEIDNSKLLKLGMTFDKNFKQKLNSIIKEAKLQIKNVKKGPPKK
ncbi:MAG: NAD-dependent epimerase/dehydratase [Berkelbacteria bacterium GW2011_GWA1_36_9]|uniref:NAD-dependent epimerase/dehydratase n=1 Tax=Berkelbacteria bacterium GW2011_GWA1_36_9 TaxID=1618331 RepID=A0A0G0IRW6_9BACT|nr:MAG: NAD-dependent epimerase/dehydratase [Berkelbacteria bacterium GW2011_GWA1_36_9]